MLENKLNRNFLKESEIFHPLAFIEGIHNDLLDIRIERKEQTHSIKREDIYLTAGSTHFKVLLPLKCGDNSFILHCGKHEIPFNLKYTASVNKKFVRLVYIKCKDDDGQFQAPSEENNSVSSACSRISLGAQLLQTFTAEKMKEQGFPAKTFHLEEDENNKPICYVFTSSLTVLEAQQLKGEALWSHFAKELMNSSLRNDNCKFLAFLSFTRYQNSNGIIPSNHSEVLDLVKGHVALGASGLALLGTGCLHTWAQNLEELKWRFNDNRKINKKELMDDSGLRGTHWACYSTGLGATLHELGHTFDLGHSTYGIMGRGFDDIYKFFTVQDKCCQPNVQDDMKVISKTSCTEVHNQVPLIKNLCWETVTPPDSNTVAGFHGVSKSDYRDLVSLSTSSAICQWSQEIFWSRSCAVLLNFHKWFNLFNPKDPTLLPNISSNKATSAHGIRLVEFRDKDSNYLHHWEFLRGDGLRELPLHLSDMSSWLPENTSMLKIIIADSYGNILKRDVSLKNLDV
ncbi:putative zinc metalloproteinase C607.06c [Limulus polyphemus]|uniref:Zinc metalloproteinase C607.06c n=1 Tax=Limulus polyphemus TaxID=6850 RepID=A0ABM1S1N6_LIMPO|nr:putative zinc metalloproteinase C607.06c [Limulus polyphemus]XP_022237538.1 putative zinc metalloproteinase C607.06c [Limulus polyphemus]XP_022237539.1 putative zinc metalloproteinase C607.06c [Limulus polyphemus]XP_022237540.1 putative zinc metalloproteinase C607.06c [Limulus polyphemus]XP_022237541.1 putative zinc metalloproteinase C607.06c [Limulus polyphemus]